MMDYFLRAYLRERPLFLSLIRAKEASLYQKYLPLKKPILDVGCGDGFFAKVTFSKCHPELVSGSPSNKKKMLKQVQHDRLNRIVIEVGLDVQDSRGDEARKLGIYKKLVIYDGKKIPFPDNTFPTVISNCVLEHIPDLELTLEEIRRVLRPGGLFLTTVMAKPWEEYFLGNLLLGDWYKNWMREKQVHLNLLTKNGWDQVFRKYGFKISQTTGYLSKKSCRLIDVCHYLSIPSLITYKLLGKWVLFPSLFAHIYPIRWLTGILSEKVDPDRAGALFYILSKP